MERQHSSKVSYVGSTPIRRAINRSSGFGEMDIISVFETDGGSSILSSPANINITMKNILFLPIDIDIADVNFTQLDKSIRLTSFNPYWESTKVTIDTLIKNNFDRILNQLPFTEITVITYKIQQRIVESHVDVYPALGIKEEELNHIRQNEPAGYRIVLCGAHDSVEVFDGRQWVTALTPSVPCCYLLHSTGAKHRVKEDTGRTIIYIRGILDTTKHYELINRSLEKYKNYTIYFNECEPGLQLL